MKLNITGGEWKYSKKRHYAFISGKCWDDFASVVIKIQGSKIESKEGLANLELFTDAGTTANKCGLLPSELLKQRDELLETLEHIVEYWNKDRNDNAMHDALWHIIETAEQALKKATE